MAAGRPEPREVAVSLAGVPIIDAAGVSALLAGLEAARASGVRLRLGDMQVYVRRTLRVAGLNPIIERGPATDLRWRSAISEADRTHRAAENWRIGTSARGTDAAIEFAVVVGERAGKFRDLDADEEAVVLQPIENRGDLVFDEAPAAEVNAWFAYVDSPRLPGPAVHVTKEQLVEPKEVRRVP